MKKKILKPETKDLTITQMLKGFIAQTYIDIDMRHLKDIIERNNLKSKGGKKWEK